MPGCVFRASGNEFAPQRFLAGRSLKACNVFLKGERRGSSSVWQTSGFTVEVSAASGTELGKQIEDALEFLNKHRDELSRLADMSGVTDLRLDFGVSPKNHFLQSSY